ncbi:hypothetical protein O1611_g7281 [Lasiodiplodia mahajangana]|uniref:Uncharacterized protein n=1 Tax=Lasiodiplodia mahajangana TaxID=1108764 RepID=A0ACC2JFX1_9PEZI|nr:hypothetical protein O1611_g7281 [Lasiodiplodia mahajangana]
MGNNSNKSSSAAGGMSAAMAMGMSMGASSTFSEGAVTLDELMRQAQAAAAGSGTSNANGVMSRSAGESAVGDHQHLPEAASQKKQPAQVNADVNEVLEGRRAQDEVLKAIFGDSSDEED